ncbi:MAG TPA: protein-glutamate O-methyltransferase CheR [Blastocatellia bacterium]|nr:protein-glutamate O-methyltransferase CheR [Blastocatellia bacterium]
MSEPTADGELEQIEIDLLFEGLNRRYGVDLRDYEQSSLRRHLHDCMRQERVETVSGFQEKALHDAECLERLLLAVASADTTMFRDPGFYRAFREKVVPQLRTYPFVRVWLAGCSTGEEVWSLAILLEEEGLYPRCRIYATDLSREVVRKARDGVFPLTSVRDYTSNYLRSGGTRYLSDYFTTHEGRVIFNPALRRNVVFSEHNLVTDGSFNEFQVVFCRNVMSHFNQPLQERVHELIYESLNMFGVLGLGGRESLRLSPREAFYEPLDNEHRLYRKVL